MCVILKTAYFVVKITCVQNAQTDTQFSWEQQATAAKIIPLSPTVCLRPSSELFARPVLKVMFFLNFHAFKSTQKFLAKFLAACPVWSPVNAMNVEKASTKMRMARARLSVVMKIALHVMKMLMILARLVTLAIL